MNFFFYTRQCFIRLFVSRCIEVEFNSSENRYFVSQIQHVPVMSFHPFRVKYRENYIDTSDSYRVNVLSRH